MATGQTRNSSVSSAVSSAKTPESKAPAEDFETWARKRIADLEAQVAEIRDHCGHQPVKP